MNANKGAGGSIPISPKHGLNPTVPVCLYCGKDKDEVAICGKINKQDDQMPMRCVIDALPCDECRKLWSAGVVLIRVSKTKKGRMVPVKSPDGKSTFYLDGSTMLITEEGAQRLFKSPMKKGDPVYLDDKVFDDLYKQWEDTKKKQGRDAGDGTRGNAN